MSVLNAPNAEPADLDTDAAKLANVKLGRYSAGGMERAKALVTQQIQRRFYTLKEAATKASEQKVAATQ